MGLHPLKKIELLINRGQFSEAEQACNALLQSNQYDVQTSFALVHIYQQTARHTEAIELLERSVEAYPDDRFLCDQLANLYNQNKRPDLAAKTYQRYMLNRPDDAEAMFNCAYQLKHDGQYTLAVQYYEQALSADINAPEEVMVNIALIFSEHLRQESKAEKRLKQALQVNSQYIPALFNLANLFEQQGDKEQAFTFFKNVLAIQPDYYPALSRLADVHKFDSQYDPHIQSMQKAIAHKQSDDIQADLLFALGKSLNDCQVYPEAFNAYQQGNELDKNRQPKYQAGKFEHQVDQIIHTYSSEWFESQSAHSDLQPIFICGMFRSGSTLCEQILAAHQDVEAGGELEFFVRQFNPANTDFPDSICQIEAMSLNDLANDYMGYLQQLFPQAKRVTDKRPDNFLYVGLIKALFPKAKIVFTQRQPLDNCLSVYFQRLGSSMNYANDLQNIGHYYLQQKKLMSHWQSLFPDSVHVFDYDNLVEQPEQSIRALLGFLELPWSADCLQFHQVDNYVKTASVWQVRQPLYRTSSGRWKHYQTELASLRSLLEEV